MKCVGDQEGACSVWQTSRVRAVCGRPGGYGLCRETRRIREI